MLAWGWRIERTREGDTMALYNRPRRISQTSQVCIKLEVFLMLLLEHLVELVVIGQRIWHLASNMN